MFRFLFLLFLLGYSIFAVLGTLPSCTASSYLLANPVPAQPVKQTISEPRPQEEVPAMDVAATECYNEKEEFDRDLAIAISASLEGRVFDKSTQPYFYLLTPSRA